MRISDWSSDVCSSDLTTLPLESWRRQQAVNLDGAFLAIKHLLPLLRESGGGSITLIASVTGLRGSAVFAPYAASKAGAIALMRSAARARSEEHTSELQSLMRISYAVFCLKKNKQHIRETRPLQYP